MAREVQQIHKFVRDPKFGLKKGVMVIRCDDGHIYEFERAKGDPRARLVRGFDSDGNMTHLKGGRLPGAVEETARDILGVFDK